MNPKMVQTFLSKWRVLDFPSKKSIQQLATYQFATSDIWMYLDTGRPNTTFMSLPLFDGVRILSFP